MIDTENDTNGSSVIYSSDLINPTMQFEGMFVGLLVTYIFGTIYEYQYIESCLGTPSGRGGLAGQNVTFYKVVFKIHFKQF